MPTRLPTGLLPPAYECQHARVAVSGDRLVKWPQVGEQNGPTWGQYPLPWGGVTLGAYSSSFGERYTSASPDVATPTRRSVVRVGRS